MLARGSLGFISQIRWGGDQPVGHVVGRVETKAVAPHLFEKHSARVHQVLLDFGAVERELLPPGGVPSALVEVDASLPFGNDQSTRLRQS